MHQRIRNGFHQSFGLTLLAFQKKKIRTISMLLCRGVRNIFEIFNNLPSLRNQISGFPNPWILFSVESFSIKHFLFVKSNPWKVLSDVKLSYALLRVIF